MITSSDVARAFESLATYSKGSHYVVIEDDKVKVVKRFFSPPRTDKIFKLTHQQIREGLTAADWDKLEKWLRKIQDIGE